jgi:PadR family transcriptional regulator, regulatory protein PadR
MNPRSDRDEIPQGLLDLLILRTLLREKELHGFEIAQMIERISEDVLQVEEGSLYPALQRLLIKGLVTGEWGRTSENRRARYYRITAAGRKHLRHEMQVYERVTSAVARVLTPIEVP